MYRKTATLTTVSSLKAIHKVCYRPPNAANSIKTFPLSIYFSTATERLDISNSTVDYQQNPGGYNHNNQEIAGPNGFRGQNMQFKEDQDGFYGKPSNSSNETGNRGNRIGFKENPGWPSGNPGDGYMGNRQNGNLGGYYGRDAGNTSGFSVSSVQEKQTGSYGVNTLGKSGNVQYSRTSGEYWPTLNAENASDIQQKSPGDSRNAWESQTSYNVSYGGVNGQYQQHFNGYYGASSGVSPQNWSGQYVGNNDGSRQGINYNYTGHNMGHGGYSPNVHQENYNNAGVYQQNPVQYNGGNQQIASTSQNVMVGRNLKTDEGSVGESDCQQLGGTIEELDNFSEEKKLKEAVEVLGLLEKRNVRVDLPRYLMLLEACGEEGALNEAKYVHEHLMRSVPCLEGGTYNKIIEMYGKCGSTDDAFAVFDKMQERNLNSWDTMIKWLAKNSLGEDAIELFTQFKETGIKPDGHMFLGVFSACADVGDIIEGMLHFESMSKKYGIVPAIEHYVSVVEMLGSTGHLDEALDFIERMPMEPTVEVWERLMHFCRIHGNTELGDRCTELVELLDPTRLHEQSKAGLIPLKASDIAKEKAKKKLAAQNLLEIRSRVHEYRAGDRSHPDHEKIYALLRGMKQQMKEAGYIPETKFVLHDIDQEGKEEALLAHSERLAVAQGLMSTSVRSPMRIIKNLRVCGDCHNALKIISALVGRELIIRDAKRFHHFKDGLCSCRDYW